MLANAKILLNDGRTQYRYFKNPKEMSEWMVQYHGAFKCVETDFLHPWNIKDKERKEDPIYERLYPRKVYS